jgi:hypothetical protein
MKDNWIFLKSEGLCIQDAVRHYNNNNLDKRLITRKYKNGFIVERIK